MKSAAVLSLAALIVGMGCIVGGVFMLAGAGWALIAGGGCCFVVNVVLVRGAREIG